MGKRELAELVRDHREDIMERWERRARAIPSARRVPRPQLRNFIPSLLDAIAEELAQSDGTRPAALPIATAERHGLDRLAEGFDLAEVVLELSLLRDTILALWEGGPDRISDLRQLNQAIDQAIVASGVRYMETRQRILQAVDHVAATGLEADDLDDLLRRLVVTFRRHAPAVDTVAILLREGDRLVARAAAGLEEEVDERFSVAVGEGFAGKIAAERRPVELSDAKEDSLLRNWTIRSLGVKALYGVPLISGGEVIGVAHMGSLSASEFAEDDRILFRAMVARATAAIHMHVLRDRASRRALALEASERRYRATFDGAAVGIAHVGLDGRFLRLNDAYCALLGESREALEGTRFQDVTHPDDLADNLELLSRLLSGELPTYVLEKRYLRRDGHVVWVTASVSLVRDGADKPAYLVAVVQDISPQRELRERLSFLTRAGRLLSSTLHLERTLDHVVDLVVPTMADWCAVTLAGDAPHRFVALAHRDPAKAARARAMQASAATVGHEGLVLRVLRTLKPEIAASVPASRLDELAPDEEQRALFRTLGLGAYLCVPMLTQGRAVGTLTLAMAGSGRRFDDDDLRLAMQLGHLAGTAIDNARAHREAETAVAVREHILRVVSHDLRNPLNTIAMASSLLAGQAGIDERARRHLGRIERSLASASRLIDDLLDAASLESKNLSLSLDDCDLVPLLRDATQSFEAEAAARRIALAFEAAEAAVEVRCDPARVTQIVGNLVGNALKFCDEGRRVAVRLTREGEVARVAVADDGPGIDPEDRPHLFEPYWTGAHGKRGTGLGLAIVKGIVESHGGRIEVESEIGVGTTFTFTLPRAGP